MGVQLWPALKSWQRKVSPVHSVQPCSTRLQQLRNRFAQSLGKYAGSAEFGARTCSVIYLRLYHPKAFITSTTCAACCIVRCGPIGKLRTESARASAIGKAPREKPASAYAPDRCGGTG